jgi:hypothetical protein
MLPPLSRVRISFGLFVIAALTCSSCSSDGLNPVSGKVLVKSEPAVGATVMFFPEGAKGLDVVPSSGVVGADGTFTLSTGNKPGAPAGRYTVAVNWPDPKVKVTEQQKMMGMAPDAPDALQGRYSREKSKLTAEIKSGDNKLEPFQLQ